MRERSLVAFTLLTQAAAGTCWALFAVRWWAERTGAEGAVETAARPLLLAALVAAVLGLAASFLHLGRPANAWRALGNLRSSWLSREILLAAAFAGALAMAVLVTLRPSPPGFAVGFADGFAAVVGIGLVASMAMAYRLRAVPAWDLRVTPAAFFGTALALGALTVAAGLALGGTGAEAPPPGSRPLVALGLLALLTSLASSLLWLRRLASGSGAEREAFVRTGADGRTLVTLRLGLTALAVAASLAALVAPGSAWLLAAALVLAAAAETAGRILFYEARVRSGL